MIEEILEKLSEFIPCKLSAFHRCISIDIATLKEIYHHMSGDTKSDSLSWLEKVQRRTFIS